MDLSVEDLVRIAHAGGGLKLDGANLSVDALARIAHGANHKGARIIVINSSHFTTDELMRIGHTGGGCVLFED
jgi:DNA replication protein